MGLLTNRIGPVFLKEESDASGFIQKMQELIKKNPPDKLKREIERQIKLASYGEVGENNLIFELKNSGMDMYVLRDIYLEHEDLSAQIDFLVITPKCNYVIECKNLYGNIEVDSKGNFIRTYELFGKKEKEGIYSPITQNERHLNVIKSLRKSTKGALMGVLFEKFFDDNYKSIVCLANPKTVLNDRYAKKEVKEKVIKADQLIRYIKDNDATKKEKISEKDMRKLADFFINESSPNKSDYSLKYQNLLEEYNKIKDEDVTTNNKEAEKRTCPMCGGSLTPRVAKKGKYEGASFLGCSNFPKCRYILTGD